MNNYLKGFYFCGLLIGLFFCMIIFSVGVNENNSAIQLISIALVGIITGSAVRLGRAIERGGRR